MERTFMSCPSCGGNSFTEAKIETCEVSFNQDGKVFAWPSDKRVSVFCVDCGYICDQEERILFSQKITQSIDKRMYFPLCHGKNEMVSLKVKGE